MATAVDSLRKAGFKGHIIDANSSEFSTASKRFSAIFNATAKFIAFPGSTEDVSIAVLFASRTNLPLAAKCGGHHSGGASSVDDGLVIDLSHLKGVKINKEESEVTVAGGSLWGEVYTALRDEGLACVGGGVHNVGIGGHLLGGGYGPLTQRYGMACDNIISATVVLANGKVVQASDEQNPDLFWGIKGASSNFGIAVEVVLRTFPDPGQWVFRSLAFSPADMPILVPRFVEHVNAYKSNSDVLLIFLNFVRGPGNKETSCIRAIEQGHSMILISEEHNDPSHDAVALDWIREGNQLVRQQQVQDWDNDLGLWANASMPNEAAEDCWGQNYPRLQKVKAKYDPGCLFDRYWHIEPSYAHI
ncbi:hypothetical protein ACHAPT_010837 [Fusarium lateritium]